MVVLLLPALVDCATPCHVDSVKSRWRAPGSTLEQNVAAAAALSPVGTGLKDARAKLGPEGCLARYHGMALDGGDGTIRRMPDYTYWALEYEVPGGKVRLVLDWPPGGEPVVCRIEGMKLLMSVPISSK